MEKLSTTPLSQTRPLKPLLYDLVYRAQQMPGKTQVLQFDNSLLVEVLYRKDRVHLQISRERHFPSLEEYWDLIKCWPYKIEHHVPKMVSQSNRKYLASMWPALSLPAF